MNKKGQRETASVWIFVLIFYYIILGLILTATANIEATNSYVNGTSGTLINGEIEGNCDSPRYQTSGDTLNERDASLRMLMLSGRIYDEDTCNEFNVTTGKGTGEWTEKSSFFNWLTLGFLGSTYYVCDGVLNVTYWNGGETFSLYGDVINDKLVSYPTEKICTLSLLDLNAGECEAFGCTFDEGGNSKPDINKYSVWNLLKDIFTNNVSFGFENQSINNILAFIFVYFPLIVIAITMYVMVR